MDEAQTAVRWRPLSAIERRVLGVLVEKAKTTPDAYPLSVNSVVSGCNQKSNRFPQMEVQEEDLEPVLDQLRELGAITEIQGGRVERYRHLLYEWLGVDKFELAVMAELMLRGAQTVGELRTRADRMETIPDLSALKPVIESLISKNLVISLSPPGRGQVVTHNLYQPQELDRVKRDHAAGAFGRADASEEIEREPAPAVTVARPTTTAPPWQAEIDKLRREIVLLKEDLDVVREEIRTLKG